jgi:hypothetical protein
MNMVDMNELTEDFGRTSGKAVVGPERERAEGRGTCFLMKRSTKQRKWLGDDVILKFYRAGPQNDAKTNMHQSARLFPD